MSYFTTTTLMLTYLDLFDPLDYTSRNWVTACNAGTVQIYESPFDPTTVFGSTISTHFQSSSTYTYSDQLLALAADNAIWNALNVIDSIGYLAITSATTPVLLSPPNTDWQTDMSSVTGGFPSTLKIYGSTLTYSDTSTRDIFIWEVKDSSGGLPNTWNKGSFSVNPGGGGYTDYVDMGYGGQFGDTPSAGGDMGFAPNQFQLKLNSGLWTPKTGEPFPLKYTNGVSTVNFYFSNSTRQGQVVPAIDGGFAIYEVTFGDPSTPIGFAKIFRQDKTLQAIIPVAELKYYLP